MSKVITTVTGYEDKVLEVLTKAQAEILGYVSQAVDFVDERVSDVTLPFEVPQLALLDEVPTLDEIVDTQFAFSKKLLANQEKFAKNVVEAVRPLARQATAPKAKSTTKRTTKKVAA